MKPCPICGTQGKVVGIPVGIQLCEEHGLFSALSGIMIEKESE